MDLYYMPMSAPCRGPLLTAKALGIEFNLKKLDLFAGEHNKPEFLAINPQHTVPTLVEGDFKIWESRAISAYLVNQYGKDDSLYPKDPKKRAEVDSLLYFDMGTLYDRFGKYVYPVIFGNASLDEEKLAKVHEALGYLNDRLAGRDYAIGSSITIADHALIASVSSFSAAGIDLSGHPNVVAWANRCKTNMPGYSTANGDGAEEFGVMAKKKFAESK